MKQLTFMALMALLIVVMPAFAQEADPTAATRGLIPFIIAAAIAYFTRRMAIGGWLFYFYLNLIVGGVVTVLIAFATLPDLNPEGWDMFYWWMAVLDYIPWLLATIATIIFGVRLLFKSQRNSKNLRLMRFAMMSVFVFSLTGLFILHRFFPEDDSGKILGVLTAVSSLIWCLYWFISRRVKYVMTNSDREWNYDDFKAGKLAGPE